MKLPWPNMFLRNLYQACKSEITNFEKMFLSVWVFVKVGRIKSLLLRMGLSPYGLGIFTKGLPSTSDGSCQTSPFYSYIFAVLTTWSNVCKIINPVRLEKQAADTGIFTLQRKYWEEVCILEVSTDGKGSGPMVRKVSCQEGLGEGEITKGVSLCRNQCSDLWCVQRKSGPI